MKTYWNKPAFYLHFFMALAVTIQLLLSLVMEPPSHAGVTFFQLLTFSFHKWVGVFAFFVIVAHWGWSVWDKVSIASLSHLFPWNRAGCLAIKEDVGKILRGELPGVGERPGLPGFIQGLGFLLVTAMALTGILIFIQYTVYPLFGGSIYYAFKTHKFLSTFVWIYWGAHVLMACVHGWRGRVVV
jgi:cytochrome b561